MSDKKRTDKMRLAGLEKRAVSISGFIKRYLGINDDALLRAELSHGSLSEIFPQLKRSSFDYILDNPCEVYNGSVVLVIDSLGNYAPYIVTNLVEMLDNQGINQVMDETHWGDGSPESWNVTEKIDYDLSSLSTYELVELMYIHKRAGDISSYNRVKNEVLSREDSARANRQSKQKALRRSAKKIKNEEDY